MVSGGEVTIRLHIQNADEEAQLGIRSGRYIVLSAPE
jgi:hypothetical protein